MSDSHQGQITDEGIAKLRDRIGKGFQGRRPWRTEVTARRHLPPGARHRRPEPALHRRRLRREDPLGHPAAPRRSSSRRWTSCAPSATAACPKGLPGVHSIWTGSYYEWERPPRLGDQIRSDSYLKEIVERGEQVRRRPLGLPDLRGRVLRPERRLDRRPQRHLDAHRAPHRARRRSTAHTGWRSGRRPTSNASWTSTATRSGPPSAGGTTSRSAMR